MNVAWAASTTRGLGLLRRRVGRTRALELARSENLDAAVAELARTPYGREVRPGMDLAAARHGVSSTLLWHLRVLAGWGPVLGSARLAALVAGFEAANISGHVAALDGRGTSRVFDLGSLAGVWPLVARTSTTAEVREVLAASPWGDPGTDDFAAVRMALRFAWARRVAQAAPEAATWAAAGAALALGRALVVGAPPPGGSQAARDATALVGGHWREAADPAGLAASLPPAVRRFLSGPATEDGSAAGSAPRRPELGSWSAEAAWWTNVEAEAQVLAAPPRPSAGAVVGVAGALGADAWRVRAALELAARGGGSLAEVLDAVA